jgi:hypothetical protein
MRKQWVAKNVDLKKLSNGIEDFLIRQGFKTRKDALTFGYSIQASPKNVTDVRGVVTVRLLGIPNNFEVELVSGERVRSSILFGFVTTMIGGGTFLLRGLKSWEALEKLEENFWVFIEGLIMQLTNSAQTDRSL